MNSFVTPPAVITSTGVVAAAGKLQRPKSSIARIDESHRISPITAGQGLCQQNGLPITNLTSGARPRAEKLSFNQRQPQDMVLVNRMAGDEVIEMTANLMANGGLDVRPTRFDKPQCRRIYSVGPFPACPSVSFPSGKSVPPRFSNVSTID